MSTFNWNSMLNTYSSFQTEVQTAMKKIGAGSGGGVQMSALFNLQMQMNILSMFGSTLTNLMSGVQSIAMAITHNLKGQ